jgi:hypothetical protein
MDLGHSIRRRILFLLGIATAFVIANELIYWGRTRPCCDGTYTTGFPLAFIEQGGWMETRVIWGGVAGDVALIIAVALIGNRMAMDASTRRLFRVLRKRLRGAVRWIPLRQGAIALAIITVACLIRLLTKR